MARDRPSETSGSSNGYSHRGTGPAMVDSWVGADVGVAVPPVVGERVGEVEGVSVVGVAVWMDIVGSADGTTVVDTVVGAADGVTVVGTADGVAVVGAADGVGCPQQRQPHSPL